MRPLFAILLALAPAGPATALPVLSEVFYDAVGTDDGQSFVELFGVAGQDLSSFTLEGINGSGGSVTVSLALSGVIPADGLFVVADSAAGGGTSVPGADLLLEFDFQNGPDSVVLRGPSGIVDALGYGSFGAGDVFAGEGSPASDPAAGGSLARLFADLDTGDNAADFAEALPTPGSAPRLAAPEAALAPAGLALLAAACVRRTRRA